MSMQIFVKYWTPFLEIITLDVEPNDTILNVKMQIQEITNIAPCEQHLNKSQWGFWKPLVDEYILSEHGIKNQSKLMFVYNPAYAAKMRDEKYQNDIINKEESSDSPQSSDIEPTSMNNPDTEDAKQFVESSDIEPTSNPDTEDVKQFVESSNDLSEIKQIKQSLLEIKQSLSEIIIKQSLLEKTRKPTLELMNNDGQIPQMVIDGYIREFNHSKQSNHIVEDINNLVRFYYKQLSMMNKQNKMVTNKENFKRHLDVPNELQNQYIMIQNVGIRNNGNKKQITLNFLMEILDLDLDQIYVTNSGDFDIKYAFWKAHLYCRARMASKEDCKEAVAKAKQLRPKSNGWKVKHYKNFDQRKPLKKNKPKIMSNQRNINAQQNTNHISTNILGFPPLNYNYGLPVVPNYQNPLILPNLPLPNNFPIYYNPNLFR